MSYHEGSNWQAKKEDEGKPLYEKEDKKPDKKHLSYSQNHCVVDYDILFKRCEDLEKLLAFADCPKILIDNPTMINNNVTEADREWAKAKYKIHSEKNNISNVDEAAERVYDLIAQLSFGGFLSERITVKEATLKINNLLEWYASQLNSKK